MVLPVYNEASSIRSEISRIKEALEASGLSFEIVAVDDGSEDGSGKLLEEEAASDPRVRLIRFPRNRGVGTARREGTRAARGRFVVWTDADLSYPNEEIPRLVKVLEEGADQVVGARVEERGTLRPLRSAAKWAIRRLASYLVDEEIPDLNSGLRAFRREAILPYLPLLPRGFSCVSTATLAFLADGREVRFEPVPYYPRGGGSSKFRPLRDTWGLLLQVVGIALYYSPLRAFLPVAGGLLLLGFGKLAYDLVAHPVKVAANTLLIFLVALNLAAIGLLADVVVRSRKWPRPE